MFVQLNKLWQKVSMLFKHLSNDLPGKKIKINNRWISTLLLNLATYTHTHPFRTDFLLTFPAWRRVLGLIPMVPFRHCWLTRITVHTHYSLALPHGHRFVSTVQQKTRGHQPMSHIWMPHSARVYKMCCTKWALKKKCWRLRKHACTYLEGELQNFRIRQTTFLILKHPREGGD